MARVDEVVRVVARAPAERREMRESARTLEALEALEALGRAGLTARDVLLALFATAMAISFGVKEPMDYSVYSASAGALLLALTEPPRVSDPRRALSAGRGVLRKEAAPR